MKIENKDDRAKEAIELFCYQTKKWIGSFVAVLGGVDVLVFFCWHWGTFAEST